VRERFADLAGDSRAKPFWLPFRGRLLRLSHLRGRGESFYACSHRAGYMGRTASCYMGVTIQRVILRRVAMLISTETLMPQVQYPAAPFPAQQQSSDPGHTARWNPVRITAKSPTGDRDDWQARRPS
jgi:hypothetical protein